MIRPEKNSEKGKEESLSESGVTEPSCSVRSIRDHSRVMFVFPR